MRRQQFLCVWLALTLGFGCGVDSGAQKRLTLQQMYDLADSLNSSIKASDFGVAEAQAGVDVARNALLPSIQASASVGLNGFGYSMDRNFSNAVDEKLPIFGNNLAVQISQVIFTGGAIKNGIEAARIGSSLAEIQASTNRNEVRYLIAGTCLEIAKLENQLKVLDSNIELTGRVLGQIRDRYDEGTALKSDITRYELLQQDLSLSKINLESARRIMMEKLAVALGLEEGETVEPMMDIDMDTPVADAAIWQNTAEESSTAIKGADLARQMKSAELNITKAERLPSIALYAGDTFNGPDVTTFISGKMAGYGRLDKNFNFATVGVGISYNIDNLYKSGRKIRKSEAALSKACRDLDAARQGIGLAVNAACIEYNNSFEQVKIREKALELALENYDLVDSRYNNGLATMTDLLDASNQRLQSQIEEINSRIDLLANYYKLLYISGTI